MKIRALALAIPAALALSGNAIANEDLAKKNNCTACHKVDAKLVGPAYKDVANKYRNDKKAEAMLVEKVKKGGMGVWGPVPMPPNAAVKDEDVKTLVKWILSIK